MIEEINTDFDMRVTEFPNGNKMVSIYAKDGGYVGEYEYFEKLFIKRGIIPQKASQDDKTCSIGYSPTEQKWYGWSHRAMCGFSVGDVVKEGDCTNSSGYTEEYLRDHPGKNKALPVGFTAKTLTDAKTMAIAFADSVG